jgi:hypothetical protein
MKTHRGTAPLNPSAIKARARQGEICGKQWGRPESLGARFGAAGAWDGESCQPGTLDRRLPSLLLRRLP